MSCVTSKIQRMGLMGFGGEGGGGVRHLNCFHIYSFSQAVTIVGTSSDLKMDKGQDEEMDKG